MATSGICISNAARHSHGDNYLLLLLLSLRPLSAGLLCYQLCLACTHKRVQMHFRKQTHTHIDSDCVSVACLCLLRLISALSCAFYSEKRNETMFALIAKHEFERLLQILLCTTVSTCRCVSLRVSLHNTCVSCKKKQTNSILVPRPECKSRWPTSPPIPLKMAKMKVSTAKLQNN